MRQSSPNSIGDPSRPLIVEKRQVRLVGSQQILRERVPHSPARAYNTSNEHLNKLLKNIVSGSHLTN